MDFWEKSFLDRRRSFRMETYLGSWRIKRKRWVNVFIELKKYSWGIMSVFFLVNIFNSYVILYR